MTTLYMQQGNMLMPTADALPSALRKLPVGTYAVGLSPKGFYLEAIENFPAPAKVYGSINGYASRILTTFMDRADATGVLLTGEKGSGKSLLAKLMSTQLMKAGVSTIVVNQPLCGDGFNTFIQLINEPAMVLFDEYEKVYDHEQQKRLLTLLDGVYPTKKLFVMTCNDAWRVDSHMRNRPGRLYYSIKFDGMKEADIRAYLKEELKNQAHTESVVRYANLFQTFNFDMLKALVQEMNRYNEPANKAYKMLNARPDNEGRDSEKIYNVTLADPAGNALDIGGSVRHRGVPMSDVDDDGVEYEYYERKKDEHGRWESNRLGEAGFTPADMLLEACVQGKVVYRNKEGFTLTFSPPAAVVHNYDHVF